MSRLTPRLRWQQAVAAAAFPASLRPVKATLLVLVALMTPTGELHAWRDEMVKACGLPPRTLDRHLQRAVSLGWLVHEDHGGRGRRGLYRAVIPETDSAPWVARYSTPDEGDSAPPTRGLSQGDSAPLGGALNKESASESERVAVDDQRGRRLAPVGTGVNATEYLSNRSSYNGSGEPTRLTRLSSVCTTAGEVA